MPPLERAARPRDSSAASDRAASIGWHLFPDYDLDVDANDRAPRVKDYPISVSVGSGEWYQPGKITSARAWASYDDGATWVDVPVQAQDGKQVLKVDTLGTSFVSLKVQLTDANGVGVTQTLSRFYGIR